jgi:hypothetical protein
MKQTCSLVMTLSLLLLGGACGRQESPPPAAAAASPAQPAAAPSGLNACALITKDDVAALAGMTAHEVKPGISSAMTSQCTFVAEDDSTVDIIIKKSPAKYDVASEMVGMKKAMPGVPVREAAGIGERAFFMGGQLNVYRADTYVLISMLGFPVDPKTDEAARKLAEKVLAQI